MTDAKLDPMKYKTPTLSELRAVARMVEELHRQAGRDGQGLLYVSERAVDHQITIDGSVDLLALVRAELNK